MVLAACQCQILANQYDGVGAHVHCQVEGEGSH